MKLDSYSDSSVDVLEVKKENRNITGKTLHYINSEGKENVYDIHRYSDKGVLYFKKSS
ncbi:MAG: hypothetical protein ACI9SJ_001098 [Flavobacteriaceae bacterium]|jgi:hypothetical protein|uniref:hypothetical protein n=1 Tax=Candidatus Marifrigoribacter sp. Uisw_064 TaxID=3230970 RepID=UPI003AE58792